MATDLSAGMLEVAVERASSLGVGNVEFLRMDAEEPTLAEGCYDTVVCRLGLMFLPRLHLALPRLAALLRPGGRLVAAVWGPPEANVWLTEALRTLTEFCALPTPPPGAPGPFGLAAPGALDGALARAGLDHTRCSRVPLRCVWPSPGAYAAFHEASPMRRLVSDEHPWFRARAWAAVAAAAERRWGAGPLRLRGEVTVASGVRTRRPRSRDRGRGRELTTVRRRRRAGARGSWRPGCG